MEEKNLGFEDRRLFARISVNLAVKFLDTKRNQQGQANTCDVSANGIGLISADEINSDASLELWLDMPDHRDPLYVRGQVVWSKEVLPSVWRAGVNLDKAELMGLSRLFRRNLN
jgi:hypothetical protein